MKEWNRSSSHLRLNRFLAQAGLGSRRKVEKDFILAGRVSVNGSVERALHRKILPEDRLYVDGKRILLPRSFRYYALHKPRGYIVSRVVRKGQRSIYSLLPAPLRDLKYAGRLDKESRGLIVLSDDGDFIHSLSHARFESPKYYRVTVQVSSPKKAPLYWTEAQWREELSKKGVWYEDSLLRAEKVDLISSEKERQVLNIILYEGRKRHIRRMMEGLGFRVLDLYRYALGALKLEALGLGERECKAINPSRFFPKGII